MISVRKRLGIGIGMCALVSLLGSNAVFAADAPAADAASLWNTLGFQIRGGVSASYNHNFNNPVSNLSQLRTHDAPTNTFTPNLAQVILERPAKAGSATDRVGFRTRLNFGPDARVSRARTNYRTGTDNNELDFQELYAEYLAPIGNGLLIQVGKINTLIGYETFSSWENPNFSRTFMYNLSQAFTTTGVRATYVFNPMVTTVVEVVNGWDNIEDNNRGKSVQGLLVLTPHERFGLNFYGSYGPEQSNAGGVVIAGSGCVPPATGCDPKAKRLVGGTIATIKATDNDTIIVEAYYGNEENASTINNPAGRNARWNGVVGYLLHNFNDQWALNSRAELFEDAGGARTCSGTATFNGGNNTCSSAVPAGTAQTLQSYTFTLQYKPAPSLITRTEFRHDISNRDSFLRGDRAVDNQSTLAFNVVYLF